MCSDCWSEYQSTYRGSPKQHPPPNKCPLHALTAPQCPRHPASTQGPDWQPQSRRLTLASPCLPHPVGHKTHALEIQPPLEPIRFRPHGALSVAASARLQPTPCAATLLVPKAHGAISCICSQSSRDPLGFWAKGPVLSDGCRALGCGLVSCQPCSPPRFLGHCAQLLRTGPGFWATSWCPQPAACSDPAFLAWNPASAFLTGISPAYFQDLAKSSPTFQSWLCCQNSLHFLLLFLFWPPQGTWSSWARDPSGSPLFEPLRQAWDGACVLAVQRCRQSHDAAAGPPHSLLE